MTSPLLSEFPELAKLSREDLEDLLVDPVYFQAVFHSLQRVKDLFQAQSELGAANTTIASNSVALQESLHKLRAETKEAFDEAKALEARWKEVEREQREVYQRFTPQFLHLRLRHATTALDDQTEALASAFVQSQSGTDASASPGNASGREVDEFVKEFKALRKIYHKRMIWGDKWANGQVSWNDD